MAKSQYYNATGKVGGTANKQTDKTFYVDSYKGNDTNVGSYLAPYKTLQKVLDECASAGNGGAITVVDIVATGYFEEGDFLNRVHKVALIAEGSVVIKATTHNQFILNSASGTGYNSFNFDLNSGRKKRSFGRITLKDFPELIALGVNIYAVSVNEKFGCCNVTFKNCFKINNSTTIYQVGLVEGCVFDMPVGANGIGLGSYYQPIAFIQKNTFLGSSNVFVESQSGQLTFRSNYMSSLTKLTTGLSTITPTYNNHIVGSFVSKITYGGSAFNSRDLANATYPVFDVNGKSSAASPQFNTVLNSEDLTYATGSPNVIGGHDGNQIGAFGLALGAQATDDANWVATGVDNTTIAGEASLTASPTGTMITTDGIQAVADISTPRRILRITLPGSIVDYQNGYTIDTTRSADKNSPAITTVEIKVSTDSTDGTDGTWSASWIKVPLEGVPLIDNAGVGNGDDAFDSSTGKYIELTFIKYKVTLRNNEISLP